MDAGVRFVDAVATCAVIEREETVGSKAREKVRVRGEI